MPGGSKFLPFSPFLLSLSVFLSLPLPFLSPLPPFFPLLTSPLVILFPFFSLFFLFFTLPSPDIARDQRSPTIKHARQFRSRPYVSREFWCNGETYFFYCVFHWNGSVGRRIKWNEVNNFVRNVYYYYLYIERLESDRSMIKVALI